MHPYRDPPPPPLPRRRKPDRGDDQVIAGVVIVTGAIPVVLAMVEGGPFGAQPSIGLLLVVLGVVGLVRASRR